MSTLSFACYFHWLNKLWLWSDGCIEMNEDCHRYRTIAEKIGSKSWRGSMITRKVTSRLNTYLISQLLDFIPLIIQELRGFTLDCSDLPIKIISKLLDILYTGETDNRKLWFPRNMSKWSIIEQVVFNRAAIISNLRISRKRETDCLLQTPFNPQTISLAQFGTAFFCWHCRFSKSRLCAIDRAAIARPLSPYSADLGHFVRPMRLTYWPICMVAGCWDVIEG